jgi:hypothetical protein
MTLVLNKKSRRTRLSHHENTNFQCSGWVFGAFNSLFGQGNSETVLISQDNMKVEILNQTITFQELASKITDTVTELILEGVTLDGDEASAFALNKAIRGT